MSIKTSLKNKIGKATALNKSSWKVLSKFIRYKIYKKVMTEIGIKARIIILDRAFIASLLFPRLMDREF